MPTVEMALERLRSPANPENIAGMSRFGINPHNTMGISIYTLRPMAKEIGKDHDLALALWQSGIHEARILAGFVDDPKQVTEAQMDAWALRGIGKRSRCLNSQAVETAQQMAQMDCRAARWNAKDALRELTSDKTLKRIKR